jgi:hypothetical protein
LKFKILFAFFSGVKRAQVARADGSHAGCSWFGLCTGRFSSSRIRLSRSNH